MTELEFLELARQKYEQIKGLQSSETFYEYEKNFEQIWVSLGSEVLEKSLGELPKSSRSKKKSKPDSE